MNESGATIEFCFKLTEPGAGVNDGATTRERAKEFIAVSLKLRP